jgi:hypothetical protein
MGFSGSGKGGGDKINVMDTVVFDRDRVGLLGFYVVE